MNTITRSEPADHAVGIPVERSVGRLDTQRADAACWEDVAEDEFPVEWCDAWRYRVVCSNGFVGAFGLESALLHKPGRWSQCFPSGAAEASCCRLTVQRKTPNVKLTGTERIDGF